MQFRLIYILIAFYLLSKKRYSNRSMVVCVILSGIVFWDSYIFIILEKEKKNDGKPTISGEIDTSGWVGQWVAFMLIILFSKINFWFSNQPTPKDQAESKLSSIEEIHRDNVKLMYRLYPKRTSLFFGLLNFSQEIIGFVALLIMCLLLTFFSISVLNCIQMITAFALLAAILFQNKGSKMSYWISQTLRLFALGDIVTFTFYHFLSNDINFLSKNSLIFSSISISGWIDIAKKLFKQQSPSQDQPLGIDYSQVLQIIFGIQESNDKNTFCKQIILYLFFFYVGQKLSTFYRKQIEARNEKQPDPQQILSDSSLLKNYYDKEKFSMSFFAFKMMSLWSLIDFITNYYYLVFSFVLIWMALYHEVSIYMGLNMLSVVILLVSGAVITQTKYSDKMDMKVASSQTKRIFIQVREKVCLFQYMLLLLTLVLIQISAFYVTLYNDKEDQIQSQEYYMFILGIYSSKVTDTNNQPNQPIEHELKIGIQLFIFCSLIFEKLSQKWKYDRFGCSAQKVAQYTEMEIRFGLEEKELQSRSDEYLTVKNQDFISIKKAIKIKEILIKVGKKEEIGLALKQEENILIEKLSKKYQLKREKSLGSIIKHICLLILTVSSVFNADIFSILNALVVVIFIASSASGYKAMSLLILLAGINFVYTYTWAILNLQSGNSPRDYSQQFITYLNTQNPLIPIYHHFEVSFQNGINILPEFIYTHITNSSKPDYSLSFQWGQYLGLGIEKQSRNSLWFNFALMALLSVYFLQFRKYIKLSRIGIEQNPLDIKNLQRYISLRKDMFSFEKEEDPVQVIKDLKNQIAVRTFIKRMSLIMNVFFHIITLSVVFLLALNQINLFSFIYIGYSMIFILRNNYFFKQLKKPKQWRFRQKILNQLLFFAIIDFLMAVIFQIPIESFQSDEMKGWLKKFGWTPTNQEISSDPQDKNLFCYFKCIIIFILSIQREIIKSEGFAQFISIPSGKIRKESLANLLNIRKQKKKILAYSFNNFKISQIVNIHKRKEEILTAVAKLKGNIKEFKDHSMLGVKRDRSTVVQSRMTFQGNRYATDKNQIINQSPEFQKFASENITEIEKGLPLKTRFSLWINRSFVDQTIFNIDSEELNRMQLQAEQGEVINQYILGTLIHDEVLAVLQKRQEEQLNDIPSKDIPQIQKAQLEELPMTQTFIKIHSGNEVLYGIFKAILSNSHYLAYFSMMVSLFVNADIVSIYYPLAVFGFGLVEETKPSKMFWKVTLYYVMILMVIQFFCQILIEIFSITKKETFIINAFQSVINFETKFSEIWIVLFIMLHQIQVNLSGLRKKSETQIENLNQGLQRVINSNLKQDIDLIESTQSKAEGQPENKEEKEQENLVTEFNEDGYEFISREEIQNYEKWMKYPNVPYVKRLFPTVRDQKPGVDLHKYSFFFLFLISIILINYFEDFTSMEGMQSSNVQLSQEMVYLLIIHILIMMIDRYTSRSDISFRTRRSKIVKNNFYLDQSRDDSQLNQTNLRIVLEAKGVDTEITMNDHQSQVIKKKSSEKEGDMKQKLIEEDSYEIDYSRMTRQEKTKLFLHWFQLIGIIIIGFYWFPIQKELSGGSDIFQIFTEKSQMISNSFWNNKAIFFFTLLYFVFLTVSALQIKYGFPSQRFVTANIQDSAWSNIGVIIVTVVPFILELKLILDWFYSSTSLKMCQWIKLYNCQLDFYLAKEERDPQRKIGQRISKCNKGIAGCFWINLILFVILLPFILLGEIGMTLQLNPVLSASIDVNLQVFLKDSTTLPYSTFSLYSEVKPEIQAVTEDEFLAIKNICPKVKYVQGIQRIIPDTQQPGDIFTDLDLKKKLLGHFNNSKFEGVKVELQLKFVRSGPLNFEVSKWTNITNSNLDEAKFSELQDILNQETYLDCSKNKNETKILLPQFFKNEVYLDKTSNADLLYFSKESEANKDLILSFSCSSTTQRMKLQMANGNETESDMELIVESQKIFTGGLTKIITNFSLFGIIFFLITKLMLPITANIYITDMHDPEPMIKLCEYIHMMRFEKDFKSEEEHYFTLIQALRSPELLLAISGSSLRGDAQLELSRQQSSMSQP